MKGKRVFVSGGAGVIGLELVPKLIERGAHVFVGDLKPKPTTLFDTVKYREGDLNSLSEIEIKEFAPEVFIHLAAAFERSVETQGFWSENFRHNIQLSNHLMTLLKRCPSLERVISASSYLTYDPALYQFQNPAPKPVILSESDPIRPRNLVGMAKLTHEMELSFLTSFADCHFTAASARIFRGYGRNSRDVISRWVRALLSGEDITVFRSEGLFDYIYARDSAEGLIRLAEAKDFEGIVNLGTGRARSVGKVLEVLRGEFPDLQVTETESNLPFEASEADINRLKRQIGWAPEYDLEQAIPEIIAYEREKQVN